MKLWALLASIFASLPFLSRFRRKPVAVIQFAPMMPKFGEVVTFDGSLSHGSALLNDFIWDFGDEANVVNSYGMVVSHLYLGPGSYTVTLRVRDIEGRVGKAQVVVVVAQA